MKKFKFFIIALFFVLPTFSQNGQFQKIETECLNVELDGSETVRVAATGRNKTDAVEQGKKNATREIIFKGIRKGSGGCSIRPLIMEVNAEEKYQYYFNVFFQDGGEFTKYVSSEDTRNLSNKKNKDKVQQQFIITVRVKRGELKQRLIQDEIIKP